MITRFVDIVHTPLILFTPMIMAWYLSLKEASILVSDTVVETRKSIMATTATSPEWNTVVVPQVLQLIQVTLPALSKGWGDGLVAIWVAAWVGAIGSFVGFLDAS